MKIKFRGAFTFDTESALEDGLSRVQQMIEETPNSLLTLDHIEPLGLHLTVHYTGSATEQQVAACRTLLELIASVAYSGYADMTINNGDSERFHAKEIAPKVVSVEDIASSN